jgi:hypothetical protein
MEHKPRLLKQAPAFLGLSGNFPRSDVLKEGRQSATFLEILGILKGPNTRIRSQIEKALHNWYIWVVLSRDTPLTPDWNNIPVGKTTMQVHFSEQAIEDIRNGLPVGLYFGYDPIATDKIIRDALETLKQVGEAPRTTNKRKTERYHKKITKDGSNTSYAKLNCKLRVEGGKGWLEDENRMLNKDAEPKAPIVFKISDPSQMAAIDQLSSAMIAIFYSGSIPSGLSMRILRDTLEKVLQPEDLKGLKEAVRAK